MKLFDKFTKNISYSTNGHVTAHYVIVAPIINLHDDASIISIQDVTNNVFVALEPVLQSPGAIHAHKGLTPPQAIVDKMLRGHSRLHPNYADQIQEMLRLYTSGHKKEYTRIFLLDLQIPSKVTESRKERAQDTQEPIVSSLPVEEAHKIEEKYFQSLLSFESQLSIHRAASAEQLCLFGYDRTRLRGILVPNDFTQEPKKNSQEEKKNQTTALAFKQLKYDEAYKYTEKHFNKNFSKIAHNNEIFKSQSVAIYNPEWQSESRPFGHVSYQAALIISTYPDHDLSDPTICSRIDTGLGLDGDYSIFFEIDKSLRSTTDLDRFEAREADKEEQSQSHKHVGTVKKNERLQRTETAHNLTLALSKTVNPTTRSALVFYFAHHNKDSLQNNLVLARKKWESQGFRFRVGFGQSEIINSGIPGMGISPIIEAFMRESPSHTLAACVPFSKIQIGDDSGVPEGTIADNNLGTIVWSNQVNATDYGERNEIIIGEPRTGKSSHIKTKIDFHLNQYHTVSITDLDGEYATFCQSRQDVATLDLTRGNQLVCPIAQAVAGNITLSEASLLWKNIFYPYLGITNASPAKKYLDRIVSPDYLSAYRLKSSRHIFDHTDELPYEELRPIYSEYISLTQSDLVNSILGYPPTYKEMSVAQLKHTNAWVWLNRLSFTPPETRPDESDTQIHEYRVASLLFRLSNSFTTVLFSQRAGIKVRVYDELHKLEGAAGIKNTIKETSATGAKNGEICYLGTQLASTIEGNTYGNIGRRKAFRQSSKHNAAAACEILSIPAEDKNITKLRELSPRRAGSDLVIPGRHGEALVSDGRSTATVRFSDHLLRDRRIDADTTASRRKKYA